MNTLYSDLLQFCQTAASRGTPEFISPNRVLFEDRAIILRRFDEDRTGDPILIVPPQAGHHSSVADYAPEQSLVQTCLRHTRHPVCAVEWKSSTPSRREETIDDLVRQLMLCVKKAGSPAILAGLCQGGWLSAIYAALFPEDVRALMLAAAPIDFTAGGGKIQDLVKALPLGYYQYLVDCGCGNISGDVMLMGWKMMNAYDRFVKDYLNLWTNVRDGKYRERTRTFSRWYEYTQDISGRWYLQAVEQLFKQNRLVRGTLEVLCEYVDLQNISCPLALLAGERDDITLVPQVHNLELYASTPASQVFKAVVPKAGHISVFMGKRALRSEWPAALAFVDEAAYSPGARVTPADLAAVAV
jgi:poly(3-hydroxyalkanoate) synthetase